jgi:hypothetical protein
MVISAWMIASFLPLPLDPTLVEAQSQTDLEQQFARNIGAIDDKAFQKATWWRNLNRIMSGIGTLLVSSHQALGGDHSTDLLLDWSDHRISDPRVENVMAFDIMTSSLPCLSANNIIPQPTNHQHYNISSIIYHHHLLHNHIKRLRDFSFYYEYLRHNHAIHVC